MKPNQLKAAVILSYISEAISILMGVLYTPVMLRILGKSEYGLYQLAHSVIAYLGILNFGFNASYIRFYSRYKAKNDEEGIAKLNGMFMTVFSVIGIVSIVAGSVLILNFENIFENSLTLYELNKARMLMIFMVFNLAVSFPGSVFSSYINANERFVFQKVVGILRNVLNPFLTIPLLFMGYKSVSLVVVQTFLSVAVLISNWIFAGSKIKIRFDFKGFDSSIFKELSAFSFWIFLNQIIDQLNLNVDKFILGMFGGTGAVAVYGVGSTIHSLYTGFSTSIAAVFIPRINRIVAQNDNTNKRLTDLFTRVGRIQFMILMLVLSGFAVFGQFFINIWAGEGYSQSYIVALLLMTPAIVLLIQNLGLEIQRAKNLHHFRSIIYFIIAVVNVIISIPLARHFGAAGAAMGTGISFIIGPGILMNIIYHKMIGLDMIYFWNQILRFIPALIAPTICGTLIIKYVVFNCVWSFIAYVAVYSAVYGLSMWILGMNKYEKSLILGLFRKIIKIKQR